MNLKKTLSSIAVGAGAVAIGLGIQYAVAAWSAAPSTPPSSNVDAPINVGASSQAKIGNLAIGTSTTQASALDVEGIGFMKGLFISGVFKYLDGSTPSQGNVLTDIDGAGTVGWRAASAAPGNNSIYVRVSTTSTTFQYIYPSDPTKTVYNFPGTEAFCDNSTDQLIGGSGVANAENGGYGNARRAIWYLGPDDVKKNGFICSSTDPNEYGRMGSCDSVQAICMSSGGGGSGPSQPSSSGVTSIIAGNNVTVNPSNGTGDVTVSAPSLPASSGSVGGGCYMSNNRVNNWGNASCTSAYNAQTKQYYLNPSCPTAYTAQITSNDGTLNGGNPDSALCLEN